MIKVLQAFKNVTNNKKYKILLLTNRDSDNVGDQMIEASDIGLIKAVMKNLNVPESNYVINSHAASIVSKDYVKTKDKNLLKRAEQLISETDLVIFGGAPLFNYEYQIFYERTAVTLEIAQKHQKPVIFSGIGVESYDENNEKCQRLKKTLNFDCVKQITTRDGIEELTKYKANEQLVIDRVSDPAVFSGPIFKKYTSNKKDREKKKIGVFVFRSNGFKDNKINFSKNDAVNMWKDIMAELESRGYDYELLTSGHFGDEAFLDYLIREHGIKESKCVFNINSPERLIEKITSYDGVISCRLHPSIISFSLDVPSVGLIWNSKVTHFYDCIGYADRAIPVIGTPASEIVAKLEEAMTNGIVKNKEYLFTVYHYLFQGIQKSLNLAENNMKEYDYDELVENIPLYEGTSNKEQQEKLKRKFRRIYNTLNKRHEAIVKYKQEIQELKKNLNNMTDKYNMSYRTSGKKADVLKVKEAIKNDGSAEFLVNPFENEGKSFVGWCLRFRIGDTWFWYLEDHSFCLRDSYDKEKNVQRKLFLPGEKLPQLPFIGVDTVVAVAQWEE